MIGARQTGSGIVGIGLNVGARVESGSQVRLRAADVGVVLRGRWWMMLATISSIAAHTGRPCGRLGARVEKLCGRPKLNLDGTNRVHRVPPFSS
jgi:hypothetical protein